MAKTSTPVGRRVVAKLLAHPNAATAAIEFTAPDKPGSYRLFELLREVAEPADRADVSWLRAHGMVYELVEAS